MALNTLFPQPKPLGGPPLKSIPITLGVPPQAAPAVVAIEIDWASYGASSVNPIAIAVDLAQTANPGNVAGAGGTGLDVVRSVYIDNSFSFVPMYVTFQDTGFTVICPANSIMLAPVFVNTGLKLAIYAQDFNDADLPVTTFHFSNVHVAGFVVGTGEFFPPVPQPAIVTTGNAQSLAAGTVINYGSIPFGTEDPSRIIYVAIEASSTIGGVDVSSVSIGGNAATLIKKQAASVGPGSVVAIYGLAVPAGASGNVTVTYSANPGHGSNIQVYAGYNLTAPLVAALQASAVGVQNPGFTLGNGNGVAIVAGLWVSNGGTLTGIANANVKNLPDGFQATCYGYQVTSGVNLTLVTTGGIANAENNLIGVSLI